MTAAAPQPQSAASLDDAIRYALDAGVSDPHEAATWIINRFGTGWLLDRLYEQAEDLLTWHIRRRFSALRRTVASSQRQQPNKPRLKRYREKFLDVPVYLGALGWKIAGDMTAEDARMCSDYYHQQAASLTAWGDFWSTAATLIEEQAVETLRDVTGWEDFLP